MIGKLSGIIDYFDTNSLILDVGGVGYVVLASSRTLSSIGQVGDTASLLITTNVREDAITLYGFADALEKQWFALLTSVQGVGAKAGMAILAVCPADQLGFAIAAQDKAALTRASGVGPKLATRILTELKDKASKIDIGGGAQMVTTSKSSGSAKVEVSENFGVDQDAVSALTNLGYSSSDAYKAVLKAQEKANDNESDAGLQSIIRLALQELSA
ncbi:MAG: Holliday junction branch migration protein RuvA [Alphaproteobacteria bacterium]|nr:MAG: Holliday junction branch migration protein RuvA [Alphaproteobacteria bacterium]